MRTNDIDFHVRNFVRVLALLDAHLPIWYGFEAADPQRNGR
ncbi:hypothetical protein QEV65_07570 [Trueperella pyogenes]